MVESRLSVVNIRHQWKLQKVPQVVLVWKDLQIGLDPAEPLNRPADLLARARGVVPMSSLVPGTNKYIYIYAQLVPQWPIDAFVWPWAMFDMTLTETLRQHVHHLLCSIAMFGGSSFLASCNQLFNMIYYDVYVYV